MSHPSKVVVLEEPIPRVGTTGDKSYIPTLVGGDYLSDARAREAQYIRHSSELKENRVGWNGLACQSVSP